jgi:tetratricopeptide (TPR) repeat protein
MIPLPLVPRPEMELLHNDPIALRRLSAVLQWLAIGLVVGGVLLQSMKQLVDLKERRVTTAINAARDAERLKKEQELQAALAKTAGDYEQVSASAKDLATKLAVAQQAAPKVNGAGRTGSATPLPELMAGIAEARRLFAAGDLDGAYRIGEGLKERNRNFGLAYFVMGTVEAQRHRLDQAEQLLRQAISCGLDAHDEAWCRNNLSVIAAARGRTEEAIALIIEAHALAPNDPEVNKAYHKLPSAVR